MTKLIKISAGCDPEIFVANLQGELRSIIGKIGGTKYHPMPLPLGPGFAVQEDNVAMEFNIPPAEGREAFVDSVSRCLEYLSDTVHETYQYQIVNTSAASFPASELLDPQALVFGCDPDFNAWTQKKNPKPMAEDKNLRSAGGHIHIGYDKALADPAHVIQHMDLYCGVPSILMDKGELRKKLYGKAGAYREKSYGAEYRVLSNYWVFDKKLIGWAWDNTERAVNAAAAQPTLEEQDRTLIQECINNNDKAVAEYLVNKYNLDVVNV